MSEQVATALTIAGSDSGGGAGLQADLKAMTASGVHCCTVVTALTAQNTVGVRGIEPVSSEFVGRQIEAVVEDISPAATKTGMLFNAEIIETVAGYREQLGRVVVDPVMVAESGDSLLAVEAEKALARYLLPEADLVTPNYPEALRIADALQIPRYDEPRELAQAIACRLGQPQVLLKGGHMDEKEANDYLFDSDGEIEIFSAPRLETVNTHGTGCAYSSLITAQLARGRDVSTAIGEAKNQLTEAIKSGYQPGEGAGTLNFLAD